MSQAQGMVTFDEEIGRKLEAIYATPEARARHEATIAAVRPEPGARGLDIGPGPGVLACELAQRVGPTGRLIAVDTSPVMLALTEHRARRLGVADWLEVREGDAASLPLPDATLDFVVASQVYEYVPDMPRALAEAYRVLRPGGRLAIVDSDWDTLIIHTEDPALTARVLRAWDEHMAHRTLPRRLPGLLRRAGFHLAAVELVPVLSHDYDSDSYATVGIGVIADFARGRAGVTDADVDAWLADVERQNDNGSYLFSLNQYLFTATKPAGDGG